jgi:hypothetical protein
MPLKQPQTVQEAYDMVNDISKTRNELRNRERALKARMQTMASMPVIAKDNLAGNLMRSIPPHLAPKNIGDLGSVMWDFFFRVKLDFGTNPSFGPTTMLNGDFKVDQEANFLLCGISRAYSDLGKSGKGAPIQITLRDTQSTRQFNDLAFPIQNIGEKGQPYLFDTPLLLSKNATFRVEASSWLPEVMATTGNGYQELVFFGLRVRDEDNVKTLATMFL